MSKKTPFGPIETSEETYKCRLCGRSFGTQDARDQHNKDAHKESVNIRNDIAQREEMTEREPDYRSSGDAGR